jgi:hypothetical protein
MLLLESVAGSNTFSELGVFVVSVITLFCALPLMWLMTLIEVFSPHSNRDSSLAIKTMVRGRLKFRFWVLAVGLGLIAPPLLYLAGIFFELQIYPVLACFVLAGLWFYEDVWVKAGQSVPLS